MKGHIHSLARFRLGCQGLKIDRGRRKGADTHSHASDVNSLIYSLKEVWCQTLSITPFCRQQHVPVNRCTASGSSLAALHELVHNHDKASGTLHGQLLATGSANTR
jgi:hypothetical protein